MKYLAKHPLLLSFLKTCDFLIPQAAYRSLQSPKKLLLSNLAHMGDVTIASCVLTLLKELYPEVEIGFLLGSWSQEVLEGHPLITQLHVFDHFRLDRSSRTLWKKILRHRATSKKALKEIKAAHYDTAIELYPYFPNAIPLFAQADIPCRIGYTSGGFGPLLTHPHPWEDKPQSMAQYHSNLLGMQKKQPPSLIAEPFDVPENYAILHMGAGNAMKEQPLMLWKRFLEYFAAKNYPVFLTGKGPREKEQITQLTATCKYGVSLCDLLTWKQLVFLVQKAKFIVSVDTAIAHIATCFQTPHLILAPELQRLWKPDNPACVIMDDLTNIHHLQELINL